MKQELIIELDLAEDQQVSGSLRRGQQLFAMARGNLGDFLQRHHHELQLLDGLRNSYPGEAARPYPDLREHGVNIGRGLAETFLSVTVSRELARLRPDGERLVLLAERRLQRLPWELLTLFGEGMPLAVKPGVELVRRLPGGEPDGWLRVPPPPLRIVFAAASPEPAPGSPPETHLAYQPELTLIARALQSGPEEAEVPVRRRPAIYPTGTASPGAVEARLRESRGQVLHLSGHGKDGLLTLEDDDGLPLQMSGEELYRRALSDQPDLRLAILSQCETAKEQAEPGTLRAAAAELSQHWAVSCDGGTFHPCYP